MRGYRRLGRMLVGILLLSLVTSAPVGLAAQDGTPVATPAVTCDQPLTIAFSVPGLNFPFFVHMMQEAQEAAARIGPIELIQLDGQNSAPKQSADVEAMIVQGVDGIVISPADVQALAPAIRSAVEAGIPVVTVDRNVMGVDTLAHVGADNVRGGELQGEYILSLLPEGGEVFELRGQPGASPAIDRDAGLKRALEGQDDVQIVFDQTANFARSEAVTVVESGLTANPEPDVIVAANDDMALGAAEAIQAAGIDVPIIGFDALPEALLAIQDGSLAATIEQFPGQQAATALGILVNSVCNGVQPVEHDTYLPPMLITAENLGQAERAAEAGITTAGAPEASPAASPTS